jgi:hypothetical protein
VDGNLGEFRIQLLVFRNLRSKILFFIAFLLLAIGCSTMIPSQPTPTRPKANADVLYVRTILESSDTWTFKVTIQHPDTGWEDYVDGWDVLLPDGTVVKPDTTSPFTRLLLHPHVNEQPFTRSQRNIAIPPEVTQVTVRAHDLIDGFGGRQIVVDLDTDKGVDFEVSR